MFSMTPVLAPQIPVDEFVSAASQGNIQLVQQYITENLSNRSALDTVSSYFGFTALFAATKNGHADIVELLLSCGASTRDESGRSLVKTAIAFGQPEVLALLLDQGAAGEDDYNELLQVAAECGNEYVTSVLHFDRVNRDKLFNLIHITCSSANFSIDGDQLNALPVRSIARLLKLTEDLLSKSLLTPASFTKALNYVSSKIPAVPEAILTKTKHPGGMRNNHYQVGNMFSYYLKNGASDHCDDAGGQANINLGYPTETANKPTLIAKRFVYDNFSRISLEKSVRYAKHETKYLNSVGRTSLWYTTKSYAVVVTEYLEGNDIITNNALPTEDFSAYSPERRLRWILSGLKDLKTLHDRGCMHGDIKPGNFRLNKATDEMKLLDFASARKVDSKNEYVYTGPYTRTNKMPTTMADDLYGMSFVIGWLCPDLFFERANYLARVLSVEEHSISSCTPIEWAIIKLVRAMRTGVDSTCTVDQAIAFIEEILKHFYKNGLYKDGQVDVNTLKAVSDKTLDRSEVTVDDVLHGRKCTR